MRQLIRLFGGLATMVVALGTATACQSPAPAENGDGSESTDLTAIGREYSQCVRDHGVPEFPDMVVVGGYLTLPDDASGNAGDAALRADPEAMQACKSILDRLPAAARKGGELSAQDRENLLKYAECMRENGVPEWPDPAADGSFPLAGTPLETEGKSARITEAQQECRRYWDKGISVK